MQRRSSWFPRGHAQNASRSSGRSCPRLPQPCRRRKSPNPRPRDGKVFLPGCWSDGGSGPAHLPQDRPWTRNALRARICVTDAESTVSAARGADRLRDDRKAARARSGRSPTSTAWSRRAAPAPGNVLLRLPCPPPIGIRHREGRGGGGVVAATANVAARPGSHPGSARVRKLIRRASMHRRLRRLLRPRATRIGRPEPSRTRDTRRLLPPHPRNRTNSGRRLRHAHPTAARGDADRLPASPTHDRDTLPPMTSACCAVASVSRE